MNASQYQAEIEDALSSHPLAGMSAKIPVGGVQDIIIESVRRRLIAMVREKIDTDEERQALIRGAIAAFDACDIPRISGLVESTVKSFVRPVLTQLLEGLISLAADKLAEA